MFKEIKKYGLIDKIIIIMANLKNDVKFDSPRLVLNKFIIKLLVIGNMRIYYQFSVVWLCALIIFYLSVTQGLWKILYNLHSFLSGKCFQGFGSRISS